MNDEEQSDSEFYYPEEQETVERKAIVAVVGILTKLKQAEIPVWKVIVPVVLIFVIKSPIY